MTRMLSSKGTMLAAIFACTIAVCVCSVAVVSLFSQIAQLIGSAVSGIL